MQRTLRSGLILLLMIPSLMIILACTKEVTVAQQESEIKAYQANSSLEEASNKERQKELEKNEVQKKEFREKEFREKEFRAAKIKFLYEDVHFKKGSYRLQPEARSILKRKAEFLKKYPAVSVIIEGHTDERGSRETNIAFGDRRAGAVKSFLIREGIDRDRLIAVSFGKERPVDTGNTEKARAKNRRVHFVIEE